MSASPIARQACSHAQAIPSRKVLITDPSQMPEVYSSTPGGTLFSTTPGGTRIVYERAFLMNLKNSPLSRTPPNNVPLGLMKGQPNIPLHKKPHPTSGLATNNSPPKHHHQQNNNNSHHADDQFDMDL